MNLRNMFGYSVSPASYVAPPAVNYATFTAAVSTVSRNAVNRAATALDKIVPGWEDKVNTETLNLSSVFDCVLGQVFADKVGEGLEWDGCPCGCENSGVRSGYGYAMAKLPTLWAHGAVFADNLAYRQAWVDLISERQAAKVPAKSDHALVA